MYGAQDAGKVTTYFQIFRFITTVWYSPRNLLIAKRKGHMNLISTSIFSPSLAPLKMSHPLFLFHILIKGWGERSRKKNIGLGVPKTWSNSIVV